MNASSSRRRAGFGFAPMIVLTTCPLTNTLRVGIDVIPYLIAIADSSSVLSLTIFNLSPCSLAISSRIGETARQGPHHSAQKSTRTGVVLFRTTSSKVEVVTGCD